MWHIYCFNHRHGRAGQGVGICWLWGHPSGYLFHKKKNFHGSYKKLTKIPLARRQTESFKKKEDEFTKSLELLFDVTLKSLHGSGLITAEDREFLLHHWYNLTRSIPLLKVRRCSPPPPGPLMMSLLLVTLPLQQKNTPLNAPALNLLRNDWSSYNVLTSVIAAVTNHGGGDIKQLSLSKSTARRHRAAVRLEQAAHIKRDFICNVGQINFDGKLLADLGGFGKVQEEENKILAICKTCTILQQLLNRQILWMACRHHVLELIVGTAFKHLFGETTSPELVTFFKIMKSSWEELNPQQATRFNSKTARTEEGFEELMQVVEAHRRKYSVKTKSDLQSFY